MKLISVNIGIPREVEWNGSTVTTGFFKSPVKGPVAVRRLNIDGDRQADLTVHGGESKAVYVYPTEHYEFWRNELPEMELPWGMFGENFSTEGLSEESVNIGDSFKVGTAEFIVTEPRMPCYKLNVRFSRPDMVKRFMASRRSGFYFRVSKEGEVNPGDTIESLSADKKGVSVADIITLYAFDRGNLDLWKKVSKAEALPESWQSYFRHHFDAN